MHLGEDLAGLEVLDLRLFKGFVRRAETEDGQFEHRGRRARRIRRVKRLPRKRRDRHGAAFADVNREPVSLQQIHADEGLFGEVARVEPPSARRKSPLRPAPDDATQIARRREVVVVATGELRRTRSNVARGSIRESRKPVSIIACTSTRSPVGVTSVSAKHRVSVADDAAGDGHRIVPEAAADEPTDVSAGVRRCREQPLVRRDGSASISQPPPSTSITMASSGGSGGSVGRTSRSKISSPSRMVFVTPRIDGSIAIRPRRAGESRG